MKMELNFTTHQKITLTIYFVLGLPALPIVPLLWLIKRYVFQDKEYFDPKNRYELIIETCSSMFSYTVFFALYYALAKCAS